MERKDEKGTTTFKLFNIGVLSSPHGIRWNLVDISEKSFS